jgi:hypothetical protein
MKVAIKIYPKYKLNDANKEKGCPERNSMHEKIRPP